MSSTSTVTISLIAAAILTRWLVAQFPHSGQGKPPMYGDYEAQRHWMEITTNLHVTQWYTNSTNNDLQYWGLDYPPLTAYHMYLLGFASESLNSSWTELHASRGLETHDHRIFMRGSVLLADLFVYIPAIVTFIYKVQPIGGSAGPATHQQVNPTVWLAFLLLYPGQILIDHGHFQYNCIFMGLVLWAVIFMAKGRQVISAILFTMALSYKQMSLYYSLPFFWYIASSNLRVRPIWKGLRKILIVGCVVISTFAIIFSPYLHSLQLSGQVMRRLFPFNRGLFEDKVANFWFGLSIFYKYRKIFSTEDLLKASTIVTIIASLPAGLHLLIRPTNRAFRYALVNTSLVFFLFSFQVHEKTILVPTLPIVLLIRENTMAANWFAVVSTFTLQPLLIKDGQSIPYFVLLSLYTIFYTEVFARHTSLDIKKILTLRNLGVIIHLTSIIGCFILSVAAMLIKPPVRYPDLHPTLNAFYGCVHFLGFLMYFYYQQFKTPDSKKELLAKKTK